MMNKKQGNQKQFVIFVGGETAGPITPLLALATAWKAEDPSITPIFLDTKYSVARYMVPKHNFEFRTMTAGKFRRYGSIKNLLTPIQILIGLFRSLFLIISVQPKVVIGAGGYVQVPVMIVAWILGIPRVLHQQDIVPTLSNKLIAPIANKITTSFKKSITDFSQGLGFSKNYERYTKIEWTGNPCFTKIASKEEGIKFFKLDNDWPTVLVIGGGSGATSLNQILEHNLPDMLKTAQVIHSAGRKKMIQPRLDSPALLSRFHQYEFIDRMDLAYAVADVVIARAGVGTITELSALGKISIIVPMPNSHQEDNAQYLYDNKAAIIIDQSDITPGLFAQVIKKVFFDSALQTQLQQGMKAIMPTGATQRMLTVIKKVINND